MLDGGNRRKPKPPQDPLFAPGHQLHAQSPEPSHHSQGQGPVPSGTAHHSGLPLANTLPYKKKNTIGMTRLKNKNILFRRVMRMRIAASVRMVLNRVASFRSVR